MSAAIRIVHGACRRCGRPITGRLGSPQSDMAARVLLDNGRMYLCDPCAGRGAVARALETRIRNKRNRS